MFVQGRIAGAEAQDVPRVQGRCRLVRSVVRAGQANDNGAGHLRPRCVSGNRPVAIWWDPRLGQSRRVNDTVDPRFRHCKH